MPIYEYRCSCGHRFEELCRINDDSPRLCPRCGKVAPRAISLFRKGRSNDGFGGAEYSSGSGGCSGCTSSSCAGCR